MVREKKIMCPGGDRGTRMRNNYKNKKYIFIYKILRAILQLKPEIRSNCF